jgi:hypothetical protein
MDKNFDFSGWATRCDMLCSDGRTIRKGAFKDNDGDTVPLVWGHQHNDPNRVLGHALLEYRDDGVYTYGTFNDTEAGRNAKLLVQHEDVTHLSIYANKLRQMGGDVLHGDIREVSLVLAGANPGAFIDQVIRHGAEVDDEAVIYNDDAYGIDNLAHAEEYDDRKKDEDDEETVEDVINSMTDKQKKVLYALIGQALEHSDEVDKEEAVEHSEDEDDGETVKDVIDSMTEKQRNVLYALVGQALEHSEEEDEGDDEIKHEDLEDDPMKKNVFDQETQTHENTLSHSDIEAIFDNARRTGSLKHAVDDQLGQNYGIVNIDYLFPDAQKVDRTPQFINRDTGWVSEVMGSVHHTPFSRIKSVFADITRDEARARGYTKGKRKLEEVFALLKRTTVPQTIYKKQKLDRDDVIDIVDFDVVAWMKGEMRLKLDEEIARAILIGDGRLDGTDDKINETNIRPVWKDDDLFTVKALVTYPNNATEDQEAKAFIRSVIRARKNYKGSGDPVMFTTEDQLTSMLLIEDNNGRIIYDSVSKLANVLRVKKIVTVPVMENQTRTDGTGATRTLLALIVNLTDYNVGADKGGAVSLFDDFDIDYNAMKYLIETRCSGALVKPYSAIAVETITAPAPASDDGGDEDEGDDLGGEG